MDALKFSIVYLLTILVPFWFTDSGLFPFFLAVGGLLGLFELSSYLKYRKTLSQRFWDSPSENKKYGIIGLSVFCIYLIIHFIFEI